MFRQILWTHWTWTRTTVLAMGVLAFTAPALLWRVTSLAFGEAPGAMAVMGGFESLGAVLVLLAIVTAFLIAAQPWGIEHETRHVYALSLPIPWTRYLALRFAAGAALLALVAVMLWLGANLALALIEVPDSLQTYAGRLALRFFLAMLVGYSATFALQHIAGKRAAVIVLVALVVGALLLVSLELFGYGQLAARLMRWLVQWPGPFAVFADSWRLIDV